jgi:hypothetical protein
MTLQSLNLFSAPSTIDVESLPDSLSGFSGSNFVLREHFGWDVFSVNH